MPKWRAETRRVVGTHQSITLMGPDADPREKGRLEIDEAEPARKGAFTLQ